MIKKAWRWFWDFKTEPTWKNCGENCIKVFIAIVGGQALKIIFLMVVCTIDNRCLIT